MGTVADFDAFRALITRSRKLGKMIDVPVVEPAQNVLRQAAESAARAGK